MLCDNCDISCIVGVFAVMICYATHRMPVADSPVVVDWRSIVEAYNYLAMTYMGWHRPQNDKLNDVRFRSPLT